KDLNDPADFFIAADHGIELALARQLRKVARVSLQRLVFLFGILIRDLLRSADRNQHLQDGVFGDTVRLQQTRNVFTFRAAQRNQQVFGADVLVFESIGFLESIFQDSIEFRTHVNFGLTLDFRKLRHQIREFARERLQIGAELLKDRQNHAFLLLDQCPEQMLRRDLRVAFFLCMRLSRLKGLLALQRQLVKTNHNLLRYTDLFGL